MGFLGVEFGWRHQIFDFVDVTVRRTVTLLEEGDDGDWQARSVSFLESEEYEDHGPLKYSEVHGTITGKAQFSSFMDQMILGVPEDKQEGIPDDKNRIESIEVQIRSVSAEDLERLVEEGRVQFFEANEYFDACVHVTVFIAKKQFDEICRAALEPDVELQVGLNIRCWYWLGPIGDSRIYFKTDGWDPAELAFFTVSRSVASKERVEGDDQKASKSFWSR